MTSRAQNRTALVDPTGRAASLSLRTIGAIGPNWHCPCNCRPCASWWTPRAQRKSGRCTRLFSPEVSSVPTMAAKPGLRTAGLDKAKRCLKLTLHKDGTLFVATAGAIKTLRKAPVCTNPLTKAKPGFASAPIKGGNSFGITWSIRMTATISWFQSHGSAPGLHRSTDGGKTWQTTSAGEGARDSPTPHSIH